MNIVVAGATGMVGRALIPVLESRGHAVTALVRRLPASPGEIAWDPQGERPVEAILSARAVVNLCGANVADSRWTAARKRILRESRLAPTRAVVASLASAGGGCRILVNASATGFYGNTGDTIVAEATPAGRGFLARLCVEWEREAFKAEALGVRTVCARFGVILGRGGALARMEPLFRKGLGGRLGPGNQWMSWISIRDAVSCLVLALESDLLRGPVNVVSPEPIQNKEFTTLLCNQLGKKGGLPVPALLLKLVFGEMADETLLSSTRAFPERLSEAGFSFSHLHLQDALSEGLAQG